MLRLFGSGSDGLCVDVVIGIYGFALITSVASRVAFAISTARRNLCSPIRKRSDCATVSGSAKDSGAADRFLVELAGIEPASEQLTSQPNYDHLRCQRIRGTPGLNRGGVGGTHYQDRVSTSNYSSSSPPRIARLLSWVMNLG